MKTTNWRMQPILMALKMRADFGPDDKLLILEDTDKDGRADKKTIFADKLDMPTGFALGHGGVYLGEGTDLVHLKDTFVRIDRLDDADHAGAAAH